MAVKDGYGKKHPLLVYRMVSNRYRPAAMLLLVMGILAQLPRFVPDVFGRGAFISGDTVSTVGLVAVVIGCALLAASIMEKRRAYVQCQPDYLLINAANARVAIAYGRINTTKSVKVAEVFAPKEIKGRDRTFIKPLSGELALEMIVSDFPLPEKTIRRRLNRFLLSPRDQGFVFIVPRPRDLNLEINTAMDSLRQRQRDEETSYVNPLDRNYKR